MKLFQLLARSSLSSASKRDEKYSVVEVRTLNLHIRNELGYAVEKVKSDPPKGSFKCESIGHSLTDEDFYLLSHLLCSASNLHLLQLW